MMKGCLMVDYNEQGMMNVREFVEGCLLGRLSPGMLDDKDLKTLWLHSFIVEKMLNDSEAVLDVAKDNIQRWSDMWGDDEERIHYMKIWTDILQQPYEKIAENHVDIDEYYCELRKSSPFVGVLSDSERLNVLAEFNLIKDFHKNKQS